MESGGPLGGKIPSDCKGRVFYCKQSGFYFCILVKSVRPVGKKKKKKTGDSVVEGG